MFFFLSPVFTFMFLAVRTDLPKELEVHQWICTFFFKMHV